MNTSHYPSLELCKKLHSIGMRGEGEYGYAEWQCLNGVGDEYTKTEFTSKESFYNLGKRKAEGGKWMNLSWIFIEAFSVMEMLDVMPSTISQGYDYHMEMGKTRNGTYVFTYKCSGPDEDIYKCGTLPNTLAEMILWLHENNFISFK